MDLISFFLMHHGRLHAAEVAGDPFAGRVLGGLTDEQMRARPKGHNSLAWLIWHMARTEDVAVNLVVVDGRQVFDDAWARRMNITRRDIGTGMTDDEVNELTARIDLTAVRAYRTAVGHRTRDVVKALSPAAWDDPVGPADTGRAAAAGAFAPAASWVEKVWQGKQPANWPHWQGRSRGMRLGATAITHNAVHLGEATCVRGQAGFGLGL